jgi:hypothetical protein
MDKPDKLADVVSTCVTPLPLLCVTTIWKKASGSGSRFYTSVWAEQFSEFFLNYTIKN